jgi:hypothetical protein
MTQTDLAPLATEKLTAADMCYVTFVARGTKTYSA